LIFHGIRKTITIGHSPEVEMEEKKLEWQNAIQIIKPLVVKIETPQGWGTGFLLSYSTSGNLCAVATAAHVISKSYHWEQPIKVTHYESGQTVMLHEADRAIYLDEAKDTAAIVFGKRDMPFPARTLPLRPEGRILKIGNEIGWIGFPVIAPRNLCFFSGRASSWLEKQNAYLVDGVAINGVSGGPSFFVSGKRMSVIGVVSAYRPNRATGETLPGLCVVADVAQFLGVVKRLKSLEEAREEGISSSSPSTGDV
jgi:hypothetical protein